MKKNSFDWLDRVDPSLLDFPDHFNGAICPFINLDYKSSMGEFRKLGWTIAEELITHLEGVTFQYYSSAFMLYLMNDLDGEMFIVASEEFIEDMLDVLEGGGRPELGFIKVIDEFSNYLLGQLQSRDDERSEGVMSNISELNRALLAYRPCN